MPDLRQQLRDCLQGRVGLVGVGNVDLGDDGFGVRLAEGLRESGRFRVLVAGLAPERHLGPLTNAGFDTVVFLDALEFGGPPGATILLAAEEVAARFPQISTHKLSLGLLARLIEANGHTRAWVLGVQPESLRAAPALSAVVQRSLDLLTELISEPAPRGNVDGKWFVTHRDHEPAVRLEACTTRFKEMPSAECRTQAADFGLRTSDFGLRTSDLGLRSSPSPC